MKKYLRNSIYTFLCVLGLFIVKSCGVSYSFTGGSIPEWMKTVEIHFFENIAPMVYPTLSQNFTEGLKERIRNQSRLSTVSNNGDAIFEGQITNYTIAPAAVEAGTDRAALNRLTITVKVSYVNSRDEEASFESSFTQYKEFSGDIHAQEDRLNQEIIEMLTEEIFNKAFANW